MGPDNFVGVGVAAAALGSLSGSLSSPSLAAAATAAAAAAIVAVPPSRLPSSSLPLQLPSIASAELVVGLIDNQVGLCTFDQSPDIAE